MATSTDNKPSAMQAPALVGVTRFRVIETSAFKDYYVSDDLLHEEGPTRYTTMKDSAGSYVRIGDCDIETFDIVVAWLNRKKIQSFFPNHPLPTGLALVKLCIFALDNFPASSGLFNEVEANSDLVLTVGTINYVYEHTTEHSSLRHKIVGAFCNTKPTFEKGLNQCSPQFLADALRYIRDERDYHAFMADAPAEVIE
ncbi:hypothetical protein HBH53_097250 [Parastagonospora nodorum]|nr:hypothetical protein HBH53_097250 [Parastagonospora nodorum]KAH3993312.1 hypothetical protein HBI10_206010 [Parastagonospora nodorum]KAH4011213.1 hypothetical protein HBI13_201760 [Parastagonospora nodorum]KAH5002117.1 hypothetical protein HBI74_246020 [Parastagonospora nodorum]KAH5092596.1 hypothetical protein HBH72_187490 [Parastagonospora nodorum]